MGQYINNYNDFKKNENISRKNTKGESITSSENALLAIVVPDTNNSYEYFLEEKECCTSRCILHKTGKLFDIMEENMFNKKNPNKKECNQGDNIYYGDVSYIKVVKWKDFIEDMDKYIDKAYEIKKKINDYKIKKEV